VLFAGGLRIDGRVEGNVLGKPDDHGLLVLSEKGVIVGSVKVHDAVINGRVEGDLEVEHFLELQANARVTGNITYRTLKLDCGATVDGKLVRMGEDSAAAATGEDVESKVLSFAKAP
jgi:cytoskeletal protein CcmA (bactofilin family)